MKAEHSKVGTGEVRNSWLLKLFFLFKWPQESIAMNILTDLKRENIDNPDCLNLSGSSAMNLVKENYFM